jgi:hypothetical protein
MNTSTSVRIDREGLVAGHFEAIGFNDLDRETLSELVDMALAEGETRTRGDGGVSAIWRDESGASIAVHAEDKAEGCVAPSFAGTTRASVRANGVAVDPECRFCSALLVEVLDGDEMLYPLATQLENVDEALERSFDGSKVDVMLTVFGEEVEVWPDEGAYAEAPGEEPHLAPQSLIPSGLFVPPSEERRGLFRRRAPEPAPQAQAIITGIVETAETLRNETSRSEFVHARLSTYRAILDVVLSPSDVPDGVEPGNVVQGSFWVMGRLLDAERSVDEEMSYRFLRKM